MKTSFSFQAGNWQLPWPERLGQHDQVFLSPPLDPMQGLALGNGDTGVLVWCEPQILRLAVNKCDLWNDSPRPNGNFHTPDEPHWTEEYTSLRQACRVEIDLGVPVLDTWYLQEFEARLDLARGVARIRSVTPFGRFEAEIFVSGPAKIAAVNFRLVSTEPVTPRIGLERWGSRVFPQWYNQRDREVRYGLDGTRCRRDGRCLIIEQPLRQISFAVAATVKDGSKAVSPKVRHSRRGEFELPLRQQHDGQLLLGVTQSEENPEPATAGKALVVVAGRRGFSRLQAEHVEEWRKFWENTHIQLADKFLENLWYLTLYHAGSSQRGRYPALFTQALWGWNRDFQPWNAYFHWNQQQLIWALPPAGHPELLRPYLDFRFAMLEGAQQAAQVQGKPGAHYCDVSDRTGHQAIQPNRTPGGQIAADFWRYYQFTGDLAYLREKGWPVICEVARWHLSMLERGTDGLYHTTPAWGYEGGNMLRDCTSELVTTRRVFEVALATAKLLAEAAGPTSVGSVSSNWSVPSTELAHWQDVLDHLAPLVTMESPVNPGVGIFAAGYQKGIEKDANKLFCGGFKAGDAEEWANPKPTCAHDPKRWGQIFSDVETSPVFPDGRLGLADRGTPEFERMLATARECIKGWTNQIVLARLGQREALKQTLAKLDGQWTASGFGFDDRAYWSTCLVANPQLAPYDFSMKDVNGPDWAAFHQSRIPMRMFEFRRIGQESNYLISSAICEALLQSHDGVIRVAPAVAAGDPFAYTLLAVGGFVVSAEGVGDDVAWIHLLCQRGGTCRVANPRPAAKFYLYSFSTGDWSEVTGTIAEFATSAGERFLLAPAPFAPAACVPVVEPLTNASGPRTSADGKITLGLPRMF